MPELDSVREIQQRLEADESLVAVLVGIKAYLLFHMSHIK